MGTRILLRTWWHPMRCRESPLGWNLWSKCFPSLETLWDQVKLFSPLDESCLLLVLLSAAFRARLVNEQYLPYSPSKSRNWFKHFRFGWVVPTKFFLSKPMHDFYNIFFIVPIFFAFTNSAKKSGGKILILMLIDSRFLPAWLFFFITHSCNFRFAICYLKKKKLPHIVFYQCRKVIIVSK